MALFCIARFELLEMTDAMMNALKVADTVAFADAATKSKHYRPLSYAALTYAKMGITSVDEVLRLVEMVAEAPEEESVTDGEDNG